MSHWLLPPPLFNPILSPQPLTPVEVLAGPFGLLAFVPLAPVVLLVARWRPRTALCSATLVWMLATLHVATTLVILAALGVAVAWILLLQMLRRRGRLTERSMIGLVWLGLHALGLLAWWPVHELWYPSRMAVFHAAGLAYLMVRLIAWGVEAARGPETPTRLADTVCWLLYAPCMRLGPVMRREPFLARLIAWEPRCGPAWRPALKRLGLFVLGGAALAVIGRQVPRVLTGGDFFAVPEAYTTGALLRVFYLVPIQVYLLLWTYNELAAALGHALGLPVDDNFNWLPRATSVRDFWRRWHITLGAWLRDYLYIPLGGNRKRVILNYFAIFAYCGVWHGASWSFLGWGLSQGAALSVQRAWDRLVERLNWRARLRGPVWTAVCWLLTMHYQLATVLMFVDFEHLTGRLVGELLRRAGLPI